MDELTPAMLALAALPYGVVLFDRGERVCLVNRAAAWLLGVDAEQLFGAGWEDMHATFGLPEAGTRGRALIEHEGRWIEVRPLELPPEAARANVKSGLVLAPASDQARQFQEVLRLFSDKARTPITVIQGYCDLLLRALPDSLDADQRVFVQNIRDRATDVIHIVNQTFTLAEAHISSGDIPLGEVEVVAVARQALEHIHIGYHRKGVRCIFKPEATTMLARTAELPLKRILWQLLDNAFRATPSGGVVTVSLWRHEGYVRIAIVDAGPGVPEASGPNTLDLRQWHVGQASLPAWRGPGLGLAIVRACLERGKLTATLSSAPGAGSTIVVSAPAVG